LTPTPIPPPGRSWLARHRILLVPACGALAVGIVTAAALLLLAKPTSMVEKMVPSSAQIAGFAYLDPSLTQKVNLLRVAHRFPDYQTDKAISTRLDDALKAAGLSFSGDVQPWLGSEVAFAAQLGEGKTADSPAALLIASRDDAKAVATLARLRAGTWGKKLQWRDEQYGGVGIAVGSPASTGSKAGAYAYVDHVVVIASSDTLIKEVIDTDQGRKSRLVDSKDYAATIASLPKDRIALVYVNGRSIVASVKSQASKIVVGPGLSVNKNLKDLDAFQGIGLALSARSDGVVADVTVKLDVSALTPATRASLSHAGRPETVLTWIPGSADGFLAVGNVNRTIQAWLDQPTNDPVVGQLAASVGLTGPRGILAHLTGDLGLEFELDKSLFPVGALVLGTDDTASMRSFLANLTGLAGQSTPGKPGATVQTQTYEGTTITTVTMPELSQQGHFVPAYAVLDGVGILASSPEELKAVIDAHHAGHTISADPTYRQASAASLTKPGTVAFVDLDKVVGALRQSPFMGQAGRLDSKTLANLTPIRALILTASSAADRADARVVLLIQ